MTILTDSITAAIDEIPAFVPRCIARQVLITTLRDARRALLDGPVCTLTGNKCLTDTWNLASPPDCSCGRLVRQINELQSREGSGP